MFPHDDGPGDDDVLEGVYIEEARQVAVKAAILLEHPQVSILKGTGLYETALTQAEFLVRLVGQSEACSGGEDFDVLLNLIRIHSDELALTLSLIRIP